MEGLNKIFCGADVKNTGICECYFDPKLITGAILVPKGKVFTSDELLDANIQETLEAATKTVKNARIFPFGPFEAITNNTEAPVQQTFGYGTIKVVREGKYLLAFQFINGGLNLSNALRTFNGLIGKYAVIFIESQNTLIGTSRKDVNGEWGLAGVPLSDLYTSPWAPSDGSNVTNYTIQFTFEPVYINEKIAFKRVSVDEYLLSELHGLEDVHLEILEGGDEGGTEVTVGAYSDCGSVDMFDLYEDEFEELTAWLIKDIDGNPKTISSITANTALKGWDIVISGGTFEDGDTITWAASTVLEEPPINVEGYEADTITLDFGSS